MSDTIVLRDPRTGRPDGEVAMADPAEVAAAAARLRKAQPVWAARGVDARAAVLRRWADELEARRDEMVAVLRADTGRVVESRLEVDAVASSIRRWADRAPELLADEPPRPSSYPPVQLRQVNDPYPVVGVIAPWNFPLLLALIDAVPALAAGSAVLIKPSEVTPRFVSVLERTVTVVPELVDVVEVVVGGPATGEAVVDVSDSVCFTGSVATGRAVARRAAERLIPINLELGGKDPAIVLPGADLDLTVEALLWGATANAGQSCQSIERIYVAGELHDQLVHRLVGRAREIPLAYPDPERGGLGPIISDRQITTIASHLADARDRGAQVRCGGELEVLDGGTYLRPTVLTAVDHTMHVMRDETFGPVLPVMAFDGVDEAIALANDSDYGLSGAVFGEPERALAVAARVRAGAISVNDASLTAIVHDGEKNAYGSSGLGGTRMGPASVRRFVRRRAHLVKQPGVVDPWWYPQTTATDDGADE